MISGKKIFLIGAVSLSVIAVFFEVLLRAEQFSYRPPYFEIDVPFIHTKDVQASNIFQFDYYLFWKYRPHAGGVVNSSGFLGREFAEKINAKIRLVTLGGSVAAGYKLSRHENYCAQLQKICDQTFGEGAVEVINLACPGYSSFQAERLFRVVVKKYHPDIAIIHFGENDRLKALCPDKELTFVRLTKTLLIRFITENSRVAQYLSEKSSPAHQIRWKIRVSPADYQHNVNLISEEARRNNVKLLFVKSCLRAELRNFTPTPDYVPPEPFINLYDSISDYGGDNANEIFFDWAHLKQPAHARLARGMFNKLSDLGYWSELVAVGTTGEIIAGK